MNEDYDRIIDERAQHVFDVMSPRVNDEQMQALQEAFRLAREAHKDQKRKTGEPYILHPIAVATIAAEELQLGADSVMAAFLHDVVEDTPYTIDDLRSRFGNDVAFLVKVVTKLKKDEYVVTKQVDNYRQMLDSIQSDIRAVLVKISDRLHNMRTLSSMRPDKQMKIAGETDYFYAPLANRLGLYNIKTELENLSFRFRCPQEYEEMERMIATDRAQQQERLERFCDRIRTVLLENNIDVKVWIEYRKPYSLWRKMQKYGDDFNHLKYRHFTEIEYTVSDGVTEKEMALRIYSILTDHFREKPGGISNYIDSPKENGYQSFHVKLLADFGRWQEVHISSERMVRDSQLGCASEKSQGNIRNWINRFKDALKTIDFTDNSEGPNYIDEVVKLFFNDDIMTFTPKGKAVVLPQKATVLDFAYEVHTDLGNRAKYARVNGFLTSIKAPLRRGDVVEVFTSEDSRPKPEWLDSVVTYKAQRAIRKYLFYQPLSLYRLCPECNPIPGEEVVGFSDHDGKFTLHKRECPLAIRHASQLGDDIVSVDFEADDSLYPVTIVIRAVDRYHLFIDIVDCISNQLGLTMDSFNTDTVDSIATITISFSVHGWQELQSIMKHVSSIEGVDEVKRK